MPVDSLPVAIGRGGQNEVPLDGDDFASAQHARFESKRDGLWVEDIGSTNGTFVNGARVTTPRRLSKGDVVRVGQTDFRVERLMLGRSAVVVATPAAGGGGTRITTSASRRSSRSRTAWAERRRARSPPASPRPC